MSLTAEAMIAPRPARCRLCGQLVTTPALSVGRIPVCNQFTLAGVVDRLVNLAIIECETCQLVQLKEAPPVETLVPEVPWISYREPEEHLDALVESIMTFRPKARRALGTGPFEQPLLSRLSANGLSTTALELEAAPTGWRFPYLETWQAGLNGPRLEKVAGQLGPFDVVSCRYLIEHSTEPVAAIRALKGLLGPDGLLLIEVPDSSKFLASCDYALLWEEHTSYFVEGTLRRLAEMAGCRILALLRYPGELEDALVAVLEVAHPNCPALRTQGATSLFQTYRDNFELTRNKLKATLDRTAGASKNRVALFGIGHQAIMFVNAFGVADEIALAVDDNPAKIGLFPPGFRVPVISSQALLKDERIKTCLFAVAPNTQAKVQVKLWAMAQRGIEFRSIYAQVDSSIMRDLA
jgi:hypothetical protein